MTAPTGEDPELDAVEAALYELDPTGDHFAEVLRETFDQLYDGQHTGRWNFDQLYKTEKTHMGTLVEINLHRKFDFEDGIDMDYRIAGVDVDCKYSMTAFGWMLPPEALGHIALLITANEETCSWRAGLIRVTPEVVRDSKNRDGKTGLSLIGREKIRWMWQGNQRLPANLFYQLEEPTRNAVFKAQSSRGNRHGQARLNELFRQVQGRIIRRSEVATVAQQDDFMKRARDSGGSRDKLRPEGILVLGHQDNDPAVAAALGLPVPQKGELVAARVIKARADRSDPTAVIDGERWAVAHPGDEAVQAPVIPRSRDNR